MYLDWMGDYENVVEAMAGFGNVYSQVQNRAFFHVPFTDKKLSPLEMQIIEYLLKDESTHKNMTEVAEKLSISQSYFSKKIKQLADAGFIERYHLNGNRKNIIIKVSDFGKKFYKAYIESEHIKPWKRVFEKLDGLDSDTIQIFADVLNGFTRDVESALEFGRCEDTQLIKIE
ncbi:MAG: MarR family winged helix-turn-helix transcriptional regulator [Clostridiales bacterium]|nr:MarR family winged helix-turn-helix transcriptional regulator [Clostridiales bacterium]